MDTISKKWIVVIPCHNKSRWISETIFETARHLQAVEQSCVLVVENGSTDDSVERVKNLPDRIGSTLILKAFLPQAGQGRAFRHAMEILPWSDAWVMLGSADLPFGTSDLERFLWEAETLPDDRVLVASKLHPLSEVTRRPVRWAMTMGHSILRKLIFQSKVKDSQSTQCYPANYLKRFVPMVRSNAFFFRAELLLHCEKAQVSIQEVPVRLRLPESPTTVRLFRDTVFYMIEMARLQFSFFLNPTFRR